MGKSSIEWTTDTWNPIKARLREDLHLTTGMSRGDMLKFKVIPAGKMGYHCEHVSPGCQHCYAETGNGRTLPTWGTGLDYTVPNREKVDIFLDEKVLTEPLRWKKPRKVFVCSMTDLFAPFVTNAMRDQIFGIMAVCRQHTFQVLTKRADLLHLYFRFVPDVTFPNASSLYQRILSSVGILGRRPNPIAPISDPTKWPLRNVHLGVSVEDRPRKDRIDWLRGTPAALRWLSIEPLLEDIGELNLNGIGWVVIGGESGPGARPFRLTWAESIISQCRAAKVPVFFKQAGANCYDDDPTGWRIRFRDRKGADPAEWPECLRVREFPE